MIRILQRLARDLERKRVVLAAAGADNARAKRRIDAAADSLSRGGRRLAREQRERDLDELVVRMRKSGAAE